MLNPNMPDQVIRLHAGELTENELLVARSMIAWANSQCSCVNTDMVREIVRQELRDRGDSQ